MNRLKRAHLMTWRLATDPNGLGKEAPIWERTSGLGAIGRYVVIFPAALTLEIIMPGAVGFSDAPEGDPLRPGE